jgi:hypothetical protein
MNMELFMLAGNLELISQAVDKDIDSQIDRQTGRYSMNIPTNCLQNIVFKSTIAKYFDGK